MANTKNASGIYKKAFFAPLSASLCSPLTVPNEAQRRYRQKHLHTSNLFSRLRFKMFRSENLNGDLSAYTQGGAVALPPTTHGVRVTWLHAVASFTRRSTSAAIHKTEKHVVPHTSSWSCQCLAVNQTTSCLTGEPARTLLCAASKSAAPLAQSPGSASEICACGNAFKTSSYTAGVCVHKPYSTTDFTFITKQAREPPHTSKC